ncbi:MAG: hypothetical protein IJ298_09750 [Ruminococcus sp.]|nr:hypothetical protein [Ruminococcus sp.]
MKYTVAVVYACIITLCLSACVFTTSSENQLVGTWREELSYIDENGEHTSLYTDITFNADGTGTGINGRWLDYPPEEAYDFNYNIIGDKIYLYFPYDGYKLDGSFCFEDDVLVLTLNYNPAKPYTGEYFRLE